MNEYEPQLNTPKEIDPLFLKRLQDMGGPKLASELINMYLVRGPQLVETIGKGIDTEDYEPAQNAAHSLISSAGNLGGKRVSDLSKSIELALHKKEFAEIPSLHSDLVSAQETFQQYLIEALESL